MAKTWGDFTHFALITVSGMYRSSLHNLWISKLFSSPWVYVLCNRFWNSSRCLKLAFRFNLRIWFLIMQSNSWSCLFGARSTYHFLPVELLCNFPPEFCRLLNWLPVHLLILRPISEQWMLVGAVYRGCELLMMAFLHSHTLNGFQSALQSER